MTEFTEKTLRYPISPDYRLLVSVDLNVPNVVRFENLIDGATREIKLSERYSVVGRFTWSPDGEYLIFAAAFDGWLDDESGITLYKLNNLSFG